MTFAPPDAVALGGLLGAALEANRRGRLSTFITDEASPPIALFAPDRVAANRDGDWYGEHAGKWLIAATRAAVRAGDAALLARARRVADWLLERQSADGYLGNYAPACRFMRPPPPKPVTWDGAPARRTWDIWTHSYLILGLIELSRACREDRYLDAARRIGDLCWRTLHDDGIDLTDLGNHFGLSATVLIDPAVELFLATEERRYLGLAELALAHAEREPRNRLLSEALAGTDPSRIATGKAYQLLWNVVGVAKLHRATGDPRYLAAALNVWRAIRDDHLTLGGGPWGGVAHRSREVFNPAGTFDPHAYVETCSTMAWIQLNRELLGILGEARFAEEIERSACNDLLGAQGPDGEDWCYYSFPNGRRVHTTYWRCCKSSGAMALEELPAVAVATTADGVAVNLLGPATATLDLPSGPVRIELRTGYPFDGRIEIAVSPATPASFALDVRIPAWAEAATLSVDDAPGAAVPGGYARVAREWRAGDAILLDLPLTPRLARARRRNVQESLAPGGEPVAQEVMRFDYLAIARGPLAYATGLIDGFRTGETVRADQLKLEDKGEQVVLHAPGRTPIPFEPYYRAGGRRHGAWRLTWLDVAPEEAA